MEENVFMTGGKALTLEDYLQYDAGSRDNLGEELPVDRKSTRLNSSHVKRSRMPSSA